MTSDTQTQTITQVVSDTQLIVASPGFSPDVTGASWQYAGYFINPIRDTQVARDTTAYPGASVVATSNSGSGGVVWGLAAVTVGSAAEGSLYAYDAEDLSLLWCNNTAACVSRRRRHLPGPRRERLATGAGGSGNGGTRPEVCLPSQPRMRSPALPAPARLATCARL
jgi:hypothetical protein